MLVIAFFLWNMIQIPRRTKRIKRDTHTTIKDYLPNTGGFERIIHRGQSGIQTLRRQVNTPTNGSALFIDGNMSVFKLGRVQQ